MLSIRSKLSLSNGNTIPQFGLGVYQAKPGEVAENAVLIALKAGYRLIDTAAGYRNEKDVGEALRKSGIPREEVFISTKLNNCDQGYESTMTAFNNSLRLLGLDYLDLYLLHSPNPGPRKRKESWQALEELVKKGLIRNIGVSNYGKHHLDELLEYCTIRPVINQIEIHPWLTRVELVEYCRKLNIAVEAYSPLAKGRKLNDERLVNIASKHSKDPAQILLRWSLQHGYIVFPKSDKEVRIKSNAEIFDFELDDADMKLLDSCDEYFTTGWDPTKNP
ncbi:2,5-didehydrogluconate reductase [Basidiobolus meristosporus CBS 931.73]|uniref:2,5-didehydrogluconate reductase n=1 Tax=Basidiobolus meristosporus CBS 931.73 TaxID=1314790 RepID=A0A1Y1YV65_9FUNG|nr:2,5-didehydrogluconate reductase [Basidiobolus meristosporus CBS 931.73]|eukprot:ORY01933.1 2,5-didehydrogluconate reductase [Basidiobolus meristosporus CBS 931.73]